jgi:hypothetical protein
MQLKLGKNLLVAGSCLPAGRYFIPIAIGIIVKFILSLSEVHSLHRHFRNEQELWERKLDNKNLLR